AVRGGRWRAHRAGAADPQPPRSLWSLPAPLSRLRPRRWASPLAPLDLGTVQAFLEADAPRVRCRQHGVVAAAVPWARHGAGFTRAFEDTAAWLATHTSRVAVAELLRVAWRTVGRICTRVAAEQATMIDLLEGLRRIGIDEVSYKKGQRYLTVVVDH